MPILRQITCDVCGKIATEEVFGDGWKGWGQIHGKIDDKGNTDFALCPEHLEDIFKIALELKEVLNYGVD